LCHERLRDSRFYALLLRIDVDLAALGSPRGCPHCGGTVHVANYPRKPRGAGAELGPAYGVRFSFCCSVEGCRRRLTPPSVRFLGRRVYLGAAVTLVSALQHGATKGRAKKLLALVGASRQTIERWRGWWRSAFADSPFWASVRGRLASPVAADELPSSLLARFTDGAEPALVQLLRLLAPITTAPGLCAMVG